MARKRKKTRKSRSRKRRTTRRPRRSSRKQKPKKPKNFLGRGLRASGRFVAMKIKDYRRQRGPSKTILGSSDTLAGAKQIVDRAGRSGAHLIIDQKTGKAWSALVARVYRVTL